MKFVWAIYSSSVEQPIFITSLAQVFDFNTQIPRMLITAQWDQD